MENHKIYLHCFNMVSGVGPISLAKIKGTFSSLEYAWNQGTLQDFKHIFAREKRLPIFYESLIQLRAKVNIEQEIVFLENQEIQIILIEDKNYPSLLKQIHAPPQLLYVKGNLNNLTYPLGIVGTRRYSAYGEQMTRNIVKELSAYSKDITIISGLALGIDAIAHDEANKSGLRTIAVLGGGITDEVLYPRQNLSLARQIIEAGGAVISECHPGLIPKAENFPQRNRIVSGLSRGVLVVEAPQRSGALITAKDALEQNREVFAIPGLVTAKNSFGPHNLIQAGAKLVVSAQDIIEELGIIQGPSVKPVTSSPKGDTLEERTVFSLLEHTPLSSDELIISIQAVIESQISMRILTICLSNMELKGYIEQINNGKYSIIK